MGEQPAEWGQQGGNRTLKALFMLGLFLPTLKTHTRTLRSRPLNYCPSFLPECQLKLHVLHNTAAGLR